MKCCKKNNKEKKKGFWSGVLYGLAPHTFCIAFIIFTILGVTTLTAFLKPLLLNPYFFYLLIALSFVFASISALIYLYRNGILSFEGAKRKWKYLLTLFGTTIIVNVLLFMIVFPYAANFQLNRTAVLGENSSLSSVVLRVSIPCPGHAPLIVGEIKAVNGVEAIRFKFPNSFNVSYNPEKTSKEQILSLDVFNTYKATVSSG